MLINYFKMPVVYTILGSKAPCGHTHGRTRTSLKSNLTNYVYYLQVLIENKHPHFCPLEQGIY